MLLSCILFIAATIVGQWNVSYLQKKYQLSAGTGLGANVFYMIINGIVSAIIPAAVIWLRGGKIETTAYSVALAIVIVISSAVNVICVFKAYEKGKIAVVNIISTTGSIILSCIWGIVVFYENISFRQGIAIFSMLAAVVLIMGKNSEKMNKKLLWIYVVATLSAWCVTLLNKQHQIEAVYQTADTLSFSVWIGVARVILFTLFLPFVSIKKEKQKIECPARTVGYAMLSSAIGGGAYVVTLFTMTTLPLIVVSPISSGIGMLINIIVPWLLCGEKLEKKQIAGSIISIIGVLLFLWN